jgi:hypothetical protein
MDEKLDKLLVGKDVTYPPRARSMDELSPVLAESKAGSSHKVALMRKQHVTEGPAYFLKMHPDNPRLAELETYCGAISRFLATPKYVPNTRPYFISNGQIVGVSSKEIIGFRSNYENPLQPSDLLINSSIIDAEYKQRSSQLFTEKLLGYYNNRLSASERIKRYASLNFDLHSLFSNSPTQHTTRNFLLQYINHPERYSVDSVLSTLRGRRDQLKQLVPQSPELLTEFYHLNQIIRVLGSFNNIGTIDPQPALSVEVLEKLDRRVNAKGLDLELCGECLDEEINGTLYSVSVQDLKNYRIIRGLGVGLSTNYIFKNGDGHNSDMSKKGEILDFDWAKANILYDYRTHDVFDRLRHPKKGGFACNENNVKHFPDVDEPDLFYWPTKQPDVRKIILRDLSELLSRIEGDLFANNTLFSIIPAQLILFVFNAIGNADSTNKSYLDAVSGFFHGMYLQINGMITQQPLESLVVKEKINYLFENIKEKAGHLVDLFYMGEEPLDARTVGKQVKVLEGQIDLLFKHYRVVRDSLIVYVKGPLFKLTTGIDSPDELTIAAMLKLSDAFVGSLQSNFDVFRSDFEKRYERFEHNSFTVEDNSNYTLLASHPVFIFHKYKTFLKYTLTDPEVYRVFAELNIAKQNTSPSSSSSDAPHDDIHEQLIMDEMERIQEIRNTLLAMPDFKNFLKEHGSFVFELIKEEFQTEQEKYSSKTKHQSYYQRLVQALDPEVIETKFNELYDSCTAEEELSEDDDLYELLI